MVFHPGDQKPPASGRKKGSRNKLTAEIKELAQSYGGSAIRALAKILTSGDSDTAKIAAAKELLDRGYGKSRAFIETTGADGTPLLPPKIVFQTTNEKAPRTKQ